MKFNELCDVILQEADYDSLTGRSKVFSLSDEAEEVAIGVELDDLEDLLKKTAIPMDKRFIASLVNERLIDFLPAEKPDILDFMKNMLKANFEASDKKAGRAANALFSWLKKKKIVSAGINKTPEDKGEEPTDEELAELEGQDTVSDDELDKIMKVLSNKDDYKSGGMGMDEVEKLGGMTPRSTGHPEDESEYY